MNDTSRIRWGVYLICFDQPFKHARHYIGFSSNIDRRMDAHRTGISTPLMRAVTEAGISWVVARIWEGKSQGFERKLKGRGGAKRICPRCQERIKQEKANAET